MKKLLVLFLMFCSFSVSAFEVQPEVSVGVTQFGQMPNMYWYQEEFPHKLTLTSPSIAIGGKVKLYDQLGPFNRIYGRFGYEYLGQVKTFAEASASDQNYLDWRAGKEKIWPMSKWYGNGYVHGFYTSAVVEKDFENFSVFGELGIFGYQPRWEVEIPDWIASPTDSPHYIIVSHNHKWQTTPLIGFGVRKNNWSLSYTRRKAEANGDEFPAIYTGWSHNVSLRYSW